MKIKQTYICVMEKLNIEIKKEDYKRLRKCIIDMSNVISCVKETGISYPTIQRIFDREYCTVEQLEKLLNFCDVVENIKAKTA